jgi:hypothetical protein
MWHGEFRHPPRVEICNAQFSWSRPRARPAVTARPTPYTPRVDFDRLIAEGLNVDVETHWGAGFLRGRYRVEEPDWSYEATARQILAQAESALDMGTGEGGVLASLVPPGVGHSMTR